MRHSNQHERPAQERAVIVSVADFPAVSEHVRTATDTPSAPSSFQKAPQYKIRATGTKIALFRNGDPQRLLCPRDGVYREVDLRTGITREGGGSPVFLPLKYAEN